MTKTHDDQFSGREAQRRFEAALRGARIAGPQHKTSVAPKRKKAKRKADTRPAK